MTTQLALYLILLVSKKNYRLIAIALSKQTKSKDPQQCFSSLKYQKKQLLIFHKFCHNINNGNAKDCKFIKWF